MLPLLENSLEKISSIRGVSFKWKDSGVEKVGFIAQDLEEAFPELVSTNPENGLKSVDYAGLIAPLVEAVKDQQEEIEKLQEEIRILKGQVE